MSRPHILLLHGAHHQPAHFDTLVKLLESRGYETSAVHNPSTNHDADVTPESKSAQSTLEDDAAFAGGRLKLLVEDQGKQVFIVAHSYGGAIASEIMSKELSLKQRSASGQAGGVLGAFYMTSLILRPGDILAQWISPEAATATELPPFIEVKNGLGYMHQADEIFYNECSPDVQAEAIKLLLGQAPGIGSSPQRAAGYENVPTTYLFCEKDRMFAVEWQKTLVKRVVDAGAAIRTVTCAAEHSPFLSLPENTVDEIDAAVAWSRLHQN